MLSTSLDKMIKDRKNTEYKDQIYFSLAALQLKKLDTLSAINSLQLATKNYVNNNSQKLASHYSSKNTSSNSGLFSKFFGNDS